MNTDDIKKYGIRKYASASNDNVKNQVLEEVTAQLTQAGKTHVEIEKVTKEIIVESQTNSATLKNTRLAQQVLLKMQGEKK